MGGTRYSDEQPVHWVRVSSFWLGETPVTNRQYAAYLERAQAKEPQYWRDRRFSAPEQPVVGVSWEEASAFCAWLSAAGEVRFDLPTEAQWEFAARGTDGREYPWGNQQPDATRACFGLDLEKGQPAPVGSFPEGKGPFGTLDQAGGVWEWCLDGWDAEAYRKRAAQGGEPVDPLVVPTAEEKARVVRGGGWIVPAEALRAAYRVRGWAWGRSGDVGFRVAAAGFDLGQTYEVHVEAGRLTIRAV
jgi:serine/threonine-protein kinase